MSAVGLDLELVARVEAHAVDAWPPTVRELSDGGWLLRATPGLDRGRSNNALTPCSGISVAALDAGLAAVEAFAARHGIRPGVQVSPLELHEGVLRELLDERGWESRFSVLVLGASVQEAVAGGARLELEVSDRATPEWVAAWEECEPARDAAAHVETVFRGLAGRARFARSGSRAVGIAVEGDGLVGLFCLAVAPSLRRQGLGSALVRGMLSGCSPDTELAYLQVQESNAAGLALYERLGFEPLYTYRHCTAP